MQSWRHKRPGYNVQVRMWGHCHALQAINASDSQIMSMTTADECQLTGSRAAQPSQPARLMPCPFSAHAPPSGLPRTKHDHESATLTILFDKETDPTPTRLFYCIVERLGREGSNPHTWLDAPRSWGHRLKSGQDLIIFLTKVTGSVITGHWNFS